MEKSPLESLLENQLRRLRLAQEDLPQQIQETKNLLNSLEKAMVKNDQMIEQILQVFPDIRDIHRPTVEKVEDPSNYNKEA